jgi:putative FmdB family regulatory protein
VTAVPLYDYRCSAGHRFEAMAPLTAPASGVCPCGADAVKVPSRVALGGVADSGRPMELMPQTWRGTYGADPGYLAGLRATAEARTRLEERHPELSGDRRPVLAHEGRYEGAPLRAGDEPASASGHAHPHPHLHPHPHPHPHPHG